MTDLTVEPRISVNPTSIGRKPLGWWGIVMLIVTEGTIFALLLFANFYLRANNHPWPPPGVEKPKLLISGIRSFILWGSSIPAVLAERALRRNNLRRFRTMIVITLVMATIFMAGHIQEYIEVSRKLTPTSNAYGSSFFTITGLHAIHLLIGMVVLGYLLVQSLRGRYDPGRSRTGVTCGILYWHFVDAVWLAVYPSLYLSVTW
ncbi:MAG: cytochrome c oxidase subunit 3 [Acidimicrobiales bacterium]